ncbi:hypothetical protein A9Q96_15720 [Rhodobacterales bacterium 52_120_T64]|nr:hypothetical protein A9Q96_15720 [Rhodobacterales bacterium 52_120_T64]
MQIPVAKTYIRPDLEDILDSEEQLLWSGQPTYGGRFFQAVGTEKLCHIGFFWGAAIMWCTLPLVYPEARMGRSDAVWVYAITTIVFICISPRMAYQRQYVLSNLVYVVTDKRAIVCRRGKNWRLKFRLYVFSCQHSEAYPYSVIPTRPIPSLQVATLISRIQLKPLGFGLSHPGQPPLWGRIGEPVVFEFVPNAEELREMIKTCAREGNANSD